MQNQNVAGDLRKRRVAGRIAGIINPRANELHGTKRVRFGWFDFDKRYKIAKGLLDTVSEWGKSSGLRNSTVRWDITHGTAGVLWRVRKQPPVNFLYNYEYYPQFMDEMGFEKDFDWIQLKVDGLRGAGENG